jgi:galactose mutarotase-like enzyme
LTDADNRLHVDSFAIGPAAIGGQAGGYAVEKRTLRAGLSEGVDVVRVTTGDLVHEVVPTRGMGVWKAWFRGEEIGWRSPVRGPVHPGFVPLEEPSGLGWLDGFDELLVRCGLESNGAPDFDARGRLLHPLHGRIANRPAHRVEVSVDDERGEVTVTGVVDEARFHFGKLRLTSAVTTRVGETRLRIRDTVENLSGRPAELQLLYHVNFGHPLLAAGARVVAPVSRLVPRDRRAAADVARWDVYGAPEAGYAEQCFYMALQPGADGRTRVLLRDAHGSRGVSLCYDTRSLPCFTVWKNTVAAADGYVTGLEPATNFPNPRSHEAREGRVVALAPGGRASFELDIEVHATSAEVAAAEDAVATLRHGVVTSISAAPEPGWSAPE